MLKENLNIKQRMRIVSLYDLYGSLLTEKQKKCMELYFYNDLSLSEVAEELEVSRQAVNDLLRRVEDLLEKYDAKLNLLAYFRESENLLAQAEKQVQACLNSEFDEEKLTNILNILMELKRKGRA